MADLKPDRRSKPRARAASTRRLTATLRARGGFTIPQEVRDQLQLEEGDQVIVSVRDGSIVLTPASVIPRDQEWFWTPEWQAKEAEADSELARGEGTLHTSEAAFLAALERP